MKTLLYYQITLLDQDFRVVKHYRRRVAHSFVEQYIQHLHALASAAVEAGVVDTGSVTRTIRTATSAESHMRTLAAAAENTFGLMVGTGSTAVTMTDRALDTKIVHGTSSGQMEHGASTHSAPQQSGDDASWTQTRVFTNSSGGSITVAETGIYCTTEDTGNTNREFLLVRDVLGSSVAVADNQSISVTYTIKISV